MPGDLASLGRTSDRLVAPSLLGTAQPMYYRSMSKSREKAEGAKPANIQVTVRPLADASRGGANIDIGPHLEAIGKDVGDAFKRMIKAVQPALPDELR